MRKWVSCFLLPMIQGVCVYVSFFLTSFCIVNSGAWIFSGISSPSSWVSREVGQAIMDPNNWAWAFSPNDKFQPSPLSVQGHRPLDAFLHPDKQVALIHLSVVLRSPSFHLPTRFYLIHASIRTTTCKLQLLDSPESVLSWIAPRGMCMCMCISSDTPLVRTEGWTERNAWRRGWARWRGRWWSRIKVVGWSQPAYPFQLIPNSLINQSRRSEPIRNCFFT